ncbi:MAG: Rnf-Nqr domain containing protein, partial [Ruthenibacterium sp.]
ERRPLVRPRERVEARPRALVREPGRVSIFGVVGFLAVGVVAVLLLLTPTRLLAAALCRFAHARFRGPVYALSAGVVYIGMYWVMTKLFQSGDITQLGLYLPLLVVDPIILKRYERVQNEKLGTALRKGMVTTLGYVLVLMTVGCVRELLGSGMLFGHVIVNIALMPSALLPSGGFGVLAVVMALWRSAVRVIKRAMMETEEDQWEVE